MNSLRARVTLVLAISVSPVMHRGPNEWQSQETIWSVSTMISTALLSGTGVQMLTFTVFLTVAA